MTHETDADWIFGYGSLIWRPNFDFDRRRPARLSGWERRFYQYSPDHRGVPGDPGRVATLLEHSQGECWGVAYRVGSERADAIFSQLDERERGGCVRRQVDVELSDDAPQETVRASIYLATPTNPHWAGPAPVDEMAECIARSEGPSGANAEYLLELADFLDELGVEDPHVEQLARRVRRRLET